MRARPTLLEGKLLEVDTAVEAYVAGGKRRRPTRDPWWSAEEVLELVAELTALRNASADALEYAVAEARRKELSWAALGRALGLRRQGAQQRYGRR